MTPPLDPMSQLVHCTVRINCVDTAGNSSFGTGYIYEFNQQAGKSMPCIVTNKHVVQNAQRGVFHLTLKNAEGEADLGRHEAVTLDDLGRFFIGHPDPSVDLAAIPIAAVLTAGAADGSKYYFRSLGKTLIASRDVLKTLSPMEEIAMIGYPNGLWDERHNLPIIRRGITATHAKLPLNGKPEFLIDAACFPGSSGSPVFLANIGSFVDGNGTLIAGTRIFLLGTLYAGPQHTTTGEIQIVNVPTDTKAIAVGTIPNNLGYVIHASELAILESAIIDAHDRQAFGRLPGRNSKCSCGSGKR